MKKLFWKFFLSILAISLAVLAVQNGFLFFRYAQSQNQWRQVAYQDFVNELELNLKQSTFPDFSVDSMALFSSALEDSRVSGFLVKDQEGRVAFAVGQTAEGLILSTLAPQNARLSETGKKVSTKAYDTVLNIRFSYPQTKIERTENLNKKATYYIPSGIDANDVIGTVTIMFESQTLSSIDILSYSPRTYKYSKDIINSCIHSLMVAIPICLLIALILSWIISSKNTKYIDSIRKALNDLSQGKSNVKLKPNKNSSLNEITIAVNELDKNLQANEKSRQAWLTSISHDLSTPATAMKMIIDGLNDGMYKPNKTTLKDLQNENNVLCERINRVIEFSTLQADTKVNLEKINCADFVKNLKTIFNNLSSNCSVEEIVCDKALINRATSELLKNAYAASPNGPVELSIDKKDNLFIISIKNKANFVDKFDCENCFEPWTKGDASRSTSGNGLGLPIVGSIAKLHGGSANLSSTDGFVTASIIWPAS